MARVRARRGPQHLCSRRGVEIRRRGRLDTRLAASAGCTPRDRNPSPASSSTASSSLANRPPRRRATRARADFCAGDHSPPSPSEASARLPGFGGTFSRNDGRLPRRLHSACGFVQAGSFSRSFFFFLLPRQRGELYRRRSAARPEPPPICPPASGIPPSRRHDERRPRARAEHHQAHELDAQPAPRQPVSCHWSLRTFVARSSVNARLKPSAQHRSSRLGICRRQGVSGEHAHRARPYPTRLLQDRVVRLERVADGRSAAVADRATHLGSANAQTALGGALAAQGRGGRRTAASALMPRCVPTASRSTTSLSRRRPDRTQRLPARRAAAARMTDVEHALCGAARSRAGVSAAARRGANAGVRVDEAGRASRSRGARRHPEGLTSAWRTSLDRRGASSGSCAPAPSPPIASMWRALSRSPRKRHCRAPAAKFVGRIRRRSVPSRGPSCKRARVTDR